jgi:hypothetical protein
MTTICFPHACVQPTIDHVLPACRVALTLGVQWCMIDFVELFRRLPAPLHHRLTIIDDHGVKAFYNHAADDGANGRRRSRATLPQTKVMLLVHGLSRVTMNDPLRCGSG